MQQINFLEATQVDKSISTIDSFFLCECIHTVYVTSHGIENKNAKERIKQMLQGKKGVYYRYPYYNGQRIYC